MKHINPFRATFTNSLHQRKPSFGVKIVLSGFTKDTLVELALKRRGQFMGGEYYSESCKAIY